MSTRAAERLRIRNNQRRSRERRKEYTQELEKRLYDLERQGVSASVEVQAAARKVARENALLWDVIRHAGLPIDGVQYYLRSRGSEDSGPSLSSLTRLLEQLQDTRNVNPVLNSVSSVEPRPDYGRVEAGRNPRTEAEASERSRSKSPPTLRCAPQRKFSRKGIMPLTQTSEVSGRMVGDSVCDDIDSRLAEHHTPTPEPPSKSHCRSPQADERRTGQLKNATSCEIAASIIAGMRGTLSSEDIQAELGCLESKDCVVDNMIVFQAMDR